jgi:hypothetical protein
MTAPQKEPCIHEDVCYVIHHGTVCYRKQNLSCCNFRSRHTPLPKFTKNCTCDNYTNCTDCQKHDAAIRNAVFAELEKLKASTDMGDIVPWCDIESLRKEQP